MAAIKTAKYLGWRVITTDNNPQNPGHRLADVSYNVDITDREGVLAIARVEQLSGILAPGTDVAVTTAAYVAKELGLAGPSLISARTLTNKIAFREFLKIKGFPTPKIILLPDGDIGRFPSLGKRWIIKPSTSSGSKGVFLLDNLAEIETYYKKSLEYSQNGEVFIEEFIEGSQHTCEGILSNGKIAFCLITDRDTADFPYTTTIGHRVPTMASVGAQKNVREMLESIFSSLEISDGPFDCDFVAHGDQVTIIEATPRIGGNAIPRLVYEACKFNLTEYAIRYAMGATSFTPTWVSPAPTAVLILGVPCSGALKVNVAGFQMLKKRSWIKALNLDYSEGSQVKALINGRCRVGEALVIGTSRADLDRKVELVRKQLALSAV